VRKTSMALVGGLLAVFLCLVRWVIRIGSEAVGVSDIDPRAPRLSATVDSARIRLAAFLTPR
jgi:hypothetical protein